MHKVYEWMYNHCLKVWKIAAWQKKCECHEYDCVRSAISVGDVVSCSFNQKHWINFNSSSVWLWFIVMENTAHFIWFGGYPILHFFIKSYSQAISVKLRNHQSWSGGILEVRLHQQSVLLKWETLALSLALSPTVLAFFSFHFSPIFLPVFRSLPISRSLSHSFFHLKAIFNLGPCWVVTLVYR